MDEYRVVVTDSAEQAIRDIAEYIAIELQNPKAAVNILELFGKEIISLSNMPSRIKRIPEQPWHDLGIRRKAVKNYYLYFWVNEEKRIVSIIDVIYSRRNQKEQLEKNDLIDD